MIRWVCLAMLVVLVGANHGVADEPKSADAAEHTEAAVAALKKWKESIVTLRVVANFTTDPVPEYDKHRFPDVKRMLAEGRKLTSIYEWIWTDYGAWRLDIQGMIDGQPISRMTWGTDGKRGFRTSYKSDDDWTGIADWVRTGSDSGAMVGGPTGLIIPMVYGLWDPARLQFLPDAWLSQGYVPAGTQSIERKSYPLFAITSDAADRQGVALDPDHSYLPVYYGTLGQSMGQYCVYGFREVNGIWFPEHGRMDDDRWTMETIEINQPIDPTKFQPAVGLGTQVEDSNTRQRHVHGATTQRDKLEKQIVRQASTNVAGTPASVDASPQTASGTITTVIACLSVGILLTAWIFRWRT